MADRTDIATPPPTHRSAHAGLLALGTVAAGLLNYVYALGMTHTLTRADYTIFAAGQGLILIEGVIGSAGVAWVLAHAVSKALSSGESAAEAVNFTFWINICAGAGFAVVMGATALSFGPLSDAAVIAATGFTLAASSTGLGYLQGMGLTERIGLILVAEVMVKCAAGFALVGYGLGSVGALLGNLFGAVVPFVSLPMYARFVGRPTRRLGDVRLWRSAGRISGLQAAVGAVSTLDAILVAATPGTAAAAAAYQAAATLGKIPLYLSTAMSTAAFPLLGRDGGRRVYANTVAAYVFLGLFCVAALVTVPRDLMLFIFNDNFADTVRWLPSTAALGLLIGLFNIVMTCDQAHELSFGAVFRRLAGAALVGIATAIGGRWWNVEGMVSGACGSLALLIVLVGLSPVQRGGLVDAGKDLVVSGKLLLLLPAYLILRSVGSPAGWLGCASALGVLSLMVAFPELAPPVLRRLRLPWDRNGSRRAG